MSAGFEDRVSRAVVQVRRALRTARNIAVLWPRDVLAARALCSLVTAASDESRRRLVLTQDGAPTQASPQQVRAEQRGMWPLEIVGVQQEALAACCTAMRIDCVIASEGPAVSGVTWLEPLRGWDAEALTALAARAAEPPQSVDAELGARVIDRLKLLGYL